MQPSAMAPRAKTAASLSFQLASSDVDNLDCTDQKLNTISHNVKANSFARSLLDELISELYILINKQLPARKALKLEESHLQTH